jgi:hypothetical protein
MATGAASPLVLPLRPCLEYVRNARRVPRVPLRLGVDCVPPVQRMVAARRLVRARAAELALNTFGHRHRRRLDDFRLAVSKPRVRRCARSHAFPISSQRARLDPRHLAGRVCGLRRRLLGLLPTSPVVSRDELTLFIAVLEGGERDIYVTRRESTGDPFPLPTKVAELSTDRADEPTWLSDDGCRIIVVAAENPYLASKPR